MPKLLKIKWDIFISAVLGSFVGSIFTATAIYFASVNETQVGSQPAPARMEIENRPPMKFSPFLLPCKTEIESHCSDLGKRDEIIQCLKRKDVAITQRCRDTIKFLEGKK